MGEMRSFVSDNELAKGGTSNVTERELRNAANRVEGRR